MGNAAAKERLANFTRELEITKQLEDSTRKKSKEILEMWSEQLSQKNSAMQATEAPVRNRSINVKEICSTRSFRLNLDKRHATTEHHSISWNGKAPSSAYYS